MAYKILDSIWRFGLKHGLLHECDGPEDPTDPGRCSCHRLQKP